MKHTNIKVPVHDLVRRFSNGTFPTKKSIKTSRLSPFFSTSGELKYVVTVFLLSRRYTGREAIRKGKAYMDSHWQEKFDIGTNSRFGLSHKYYFARLFKKHTGITPYNYYQELKIKKLKEALRDQGKTVAQAFCGVRDGLQRILCKAIQSEGWRDAVPIQQIRTRIVFFEASVLTLVAQDSNGLTNLSIPFLSFGPFLFILKNKK